MTYLKYTLSAAALLFAVTAGCDSDKETKAGDDARSDTRPTAAKKASPEPQSDEGDDSAESRPAAAASESGTIESEPPLEIDPLLEPKDLQEIAKISKAEETDLVGRDPSPTYNSARLRPADSSGYGAGVQVWAFDAPADAADRLGELRSQYLNVTDLKTEKGEELGESAFLSKRGGIRNIVFQSDKPPRVVAVSCSVESCKSLSDALELAIRVRRRVSATE